MRKMNEGFKDYSNNDRTNLCVKCRKVQGVHEINFGVWLCRLCFIGRQADIKAPHVHWPTRETVDTLLEAVYYLSYTHKDKPWQHMFLSDNIRGDRGIVAYTVDEDYFEDDPLGVPWARQFRYYDLYNRRYLKYGDSFFERASMFKGDWQTVRKHVLDMAADLNEKGGSNPFRGNVCIAIVMQSKMIHYINPSKMRKFCYEYEAERIPYNESSPECSIPISKEDIISRYDPFPTTSSNKSTIRA
jgi:ribosomal protein L37AE/L43A